MNNHINLNNRHIYILILVGLLNLLLPLTAFGWGTYSVTGCGNVILSPGDVYQGGSTAYANSYESDLQDWLGATYDGRYSFVEQTPYVQDYLGNKLHFRKGASDSTMVASNNGTAYCAFTVSLDPDYSGEDVSVYLYLMRATTQIVSVARFFIKGKKHPKCDMVGNPVSAYYGNKQINEIDISKNDLMLNRQYGRRIISITDTGKPWNRPFAATNWNHNWNKYIYKATSNDTIILMNGTEGASKFIRVAGSTNYKSERQGMGYLDSIPGGGWNLNISDGSRYRFNIYGSLDSLLLKNGNYYRLWHTADSTYLDSITNMTNDRLKFRYNIANRLARVFYDSTQNFIEYRYDSTITGWSISQVLMHYSPSDSVKVISRYYYDGYVPNYVGAGNISVYQKGYNYSDTIYTNNRNKGDRTICWYDSTYRGRVSYQEVVHGDNDTGHVDDEVTYRAYFKYYFGTGTTGYDSTKVYYWEDQPFTGAHDPADTSFKPKDSLSAWTDNEKYFIRTLIFNKDGTKYKDMTYSPITGITVTTKDTLYDKDYNPGLVIGSNNDSTKYYYSHYHNPGDTTTRYWPSPTKIKYPNGDSVLTYFSAKGDSNYRLPDSTIDEAGKRTCHYYDASNNYVDTATVYKNRVLADGEGSSHDVSQRYHYNSKGNLTETLDLLGHKTIMHYTDSDTGQYLIEQRIDMGTAGEGNEDIVTQYGYNLTQGTMDTMTFYRDYPNDPSRTFYTYDVNKRLVKTVYPDTSVDSMTYDLRGNLLEKITQKSYTLLYKAIYEYDPHDHLTKLKEYKDPQNSPNDYDSTVYTYNLHDRLISQTNALGQTTYYNYCMDRLVKTTYPDDTYDSLGYWAGGDLKFKLDRKGQVTYYQYDGYNGGCGCMSSSRSRLAKKYYYDSLDQYQNGFAYPSDSVIYDYDQVGNRTKMVDKNGTTMYSYDDMNRLWSDSCGYLNTKNRYQYDMAGNRTKLNVYQGNDTTVCYLDQNYDNYDAANRVGLTIASGDTFDLSYWDTGTPKEVQYPNGAKEVYGLNVRGQLDSIATTLGDTLTWFKHSYGYNGLGDREWQYIYQTRPEVSTLSDTFKYGYDGLRRLTTAIYPPSTNSGDTVTYVYDAVGNRLEKQSMVNGTTTYTIDNLTNRMAQANNIYFTYDSSGNWTRKAHDTDEGLVTDIIFTYDHENRLVDARGPGYNPYYMTTYYNGDGVRLAKSTNADAEKRYAYDGMNTVVEQDASGYLRYKYVYVNGMLLSRIDGSDNKYYYHRDGLGSIIGVSNSTPEITTAQLFDEFGNWLYFDSDWDYYGYTGQEYDWTLMDAVNLRAREYYPEYGRFMQEDPIGDQGGLNWYGYTGNNPVNYIDPKGLEGSYGGWMLIWPPTLRYGIGGGIMYYYYQQMIKMNWKGADAYFHCLGSCEAAKWAGPYTSLYWGVFRELTDEIRGKGWSGEDIKSNIQGINCPLSQTCKEKCKPLVPKGMPLD